MQSVHYRDAREYEKGKEVTHVFCGARPVLYCGSRSLLLFRVDGGGIVISRTFEEKNEKRETKKIFRPSPV